MTSLNSKRFIVFLVCLFSLSLIGFAGDYQPIKDKILSPWAKDVSPKNALPEYPRPQMVRNDWLNLNGLWDYAIIAKDQPFPKGYDGKILVPFAAESALSGVGKRVGGKNRLWYRRSFNASSSWKNKRILLHFGAVDWDTTVWLNGKKLGSHKGGYDAFTFDITNALKPSGPQELILSVWDPTNTHTQPRGKQVNRPGGIMYTAVTGIWQTVWIEPVPETFIRSFIITPDVDNGKVDVVVDIAGENKDCSVVATAKDGWFTTAKASGPAGKWISMGIDKVKLWSPDSPFLYDLELTLKDKDGKTIDKVKSYFGMRKISLGRDKKGLVRMMLNDEPVFQFGPLDQGWWPDGLYTAPTDRALKYDIEITKKYGFNMARKHVKVEPARWYYWADKLGLLVWQDMPSGDKGIGSNDPDLVRSEDSANQYMTELVEMIDQFRNHPSIVVWVPFNEGWGQFDTDKVTQIVKEFDPSRLVNPASGWTDRGTGDVHDIHSYPGPAMPEPEQARAIVLGEFGGLGLAVPGHTWQEKKNWGYRNLKNVSDLTSAYSDLIVKLYPMIDAGLSAAVYTQTTDVEIEVNGLMTYDRQLKMDPKQIKKINAGFFKPMIKAESDIFTDSTKVEITDGSKKGKVRYTTDGTEPGGSSKVYIKPIFIKETTTIKAKTFWPDFSSSSTSEYTCTKVTLKDAEAKKGLRLGLKYEYIEDDKKTGSLTTDFKNIKPKKTGTTYKIDTSLAKRDTYFALRFEGFVKVFTDGIYTFYTTSDDGSTLSISDTQVVANDYVQGMTERSGSIALKAGLHPIKIDYAQGMGGFGLQVHYKAPGQNKKILPPEILFN